MKITGKELLFAGVLLLSAMSCRNSDQHEPEGWAYDQSFVTQATISSLFEIQAGQLAQQRTVSNDVWSFALRMINEHTAASDTLARLATAHHFLVPAGLDQRHQRIYDELSQLYGPAFDQRYMTEMVSSHQETIRLFEVASQTLRNAELRTFAIQIVPGLRQHLEHAQRLHPEVSR
jgi:putative membrane protein